MTTIYQLKSNMISYIHLNPHLLMLEAPYELTGSTKSGLATAATTADAQWMSGHL